MWRRDWTPAPSSLRPHSFFSFFFSLFSFFLETSTSRIFSSLRFSRCLRAVIMQRNLSRVSPIVWEFPGAKPLWHVFDRIAQSVFVQEKDLVGPDEIRWTKPTVSLQNWSSTGCSARKGGFVAQHSFSRVVLSSVAAGTVSSIVSLIAFLAVQWLYPWLYSTRVLSPIFNSIVVASAVSSIVKWLYPLSGMLTSRVVVFLYVY